MAVDPRRRQKKLERKHSKEKARKRFELRRSQVGLAERLQRAAQAPILESIMMDSTEDQGITNVLISRQLAGGNIAYAGFLVDMFCLGVKDATCGIVSPEHYRMLVLQWKRTAELPLKPITPSAARKLVEGAVAYAHKLGFAPHPNFAEAQYIFGEIDASESQEEFTYGRNGKPFFIAGPHDSPSRCQYIFDTLTQSCGKGNFDFLYMRLG